MRLLFVSGMLLLFVGLVVVFPDDGSAAVSTVVPTSGILTTPFGGCTVDGQCHAAIDIAGNDTTPPGLPVYSMADGTVVQRLQEDGSYGCSIAIDHGDQGNGLHLFTVYAHMGFDNPNGTTGGCYFDVSNGQTVSKGQKLGNQGNAGAATGVHLHFGTFLYTGNWSGPHGAFDPRTCVGYSSSYVALSAGNPCGPGSTPTPTPVPTPPPPPPCNAGSSCFQRFIAQNATALGQAGANWKFEVADFDRDGRADLIGILLNHTGSNSTEIHILSGASNFQQFILHAGTPLGETDAENWDFAMGDWDRDGVPDLIGILKQNTGSGQTEVHILSGASNFQQWLVRTGTLLGPAGANWRFEAGDYNRDGVADLVGILMNQTGSGYTEVHILSGASNFQQWLAQDATPLGETGADSLPWVT